MKLANFLLVEIKQLLLRTTRFIKCIHNAQLKLINLQKNWNPRFMSSKENTDCTQIINLNRPMSLAIHNFSDDDDFSDEDVKSVKSDQEEEEEGVLVEDLSPEERRKWIDEQVLLVYIGAVYQTVLEGGAECLLYDNFFFLAEEDQQYYVNQYYKKFGAFINKWNQLSTENKKKIEEMCKKNKEEDLDKYFDNFEENSKAVYEIVINIPHFVSLKHV